MKMVRPADVVSTTIGANVKNRSSNTHSNRSTQNFLLAVHYSINIIFVYFPLSPLEINFRQNTYSIATRMMRLVISRRKKGDFAD